MGNTVDLSQLIALEPVTTEFSTLDNDYMFMRITESDRTAEKFSGGPVRFDGMSWLLCFKGGMDIEVNLTSASLTPNSIAVTRPGSFFELKHIDWTDLDCYVLFTSREFMRDVNFDLNILGAYPPSHKGLSDNPVMKITESEAKLLKGYYEILHHNSVNPDSTYSKAIARSVIAALTYQLLQIISHKLPSTESGQPHSRRSAYISEFVQLVHDHHRKERSVAFYAEKLFISPKYLSLIIKEALGRSAAEIIDEYVILEAKNMLRFSGKNIQQVSYELNFPNQSSFGKYFKHLVGMSPSEYQRSN